MSDGNKKESHHYLDNKKFLEELKSYKQKCRDTPDDQELPELNEYLVESIMLLCDKLSKRGNFINYPYRDDMVGEAILDCLKAIGNFDPDVGTNPFAYFTSVAWYAFLRKIKKEKKQDKTIYALIKEGNGEGAYTKWLKENGHLDSHASEFDIQEYHRLTDDDVKEIEEAKAKKKKKKTSKKNPKKSVFDDGDDKND
jgi:DNA-directed RNA polymerase specialized sigma subunit